MIAHRRTSTIGATKPTDGDPWAFAGVRAVLAALVLINVPGCGAGSRGAQPAPGRAALRVLVRAEPKSGWRQTDQTIYELSTVGAGRAYETINYRALEDIVVWVETPAAQDEGAGWRSISIDVGRPSETFRAAGLRDPWTIANSAPEPLPIYVRHESGAVTDLGAIAPGGQITHEPKQPGLTEILSDARPDPLARVYVAPISTSSGERVRVVRSGTKIVFDDLPPGAARVTVWHPRLPGSTRQVNLAPGGMTDATLIVGVNQLPEVP